LNIQNGQFVKCGIVGLLNLKAREAGELRDIRRDLLTEQRDADLKIGLRCPRCDKRLDNTRKLVLGAKHLRTREQVPANLIAVLDEARVRRAESTRKAERRRE